jgi:hypothetical protein
MKLRSHITHAKQLYNDLDRSIFTDKNTTKRLKGSGNDNHRYDENFPFETNSVWYTTEPGATDNWVKDSTNLLDPIEVQTAINFNRYFYLLSTRPLNVFYKTPQEEWARRNSDEYVLALRNEYFFISSVLHPKAKIKKAYLSLFMINPYVKNEGFGKALLQWYERYLKNFGIEYIYLTPLKRAGRDDAYTYWYRQGFDYVKDPDFMSRLDAELDGDKDRKGITKPYPYYPPATTWPATAPGPWLSLKQPLVNPVERKTLLKNEVANPRIHQIQIPKSKARWYSVHMWKRIEPSVPSVHSNATFQAYLDAVPIDPVSYDEPIGFHYMVDLKSNTYLQRVEGDLPPEDSDEYRVLREQMECEAKPVFFKKMNDVRRRAGIPDVDKPTLYTETMMQEDYNTCSLTTIPTSSVPDLDAQFNVAYDTQLPPLPPSTKQTNNSDVDIDLKAIPAPIETLATSDDEETGSTLPPTLGSFDKNESNDKEPIFDIDTSLGDIVEAARAQRSRIRARENVDEEKEPPKQRLKRRSIREQDETKTNQSAEQRQEEIIDLTGEDDKTEEEIQLANARRTATGRARDNMMKKYYRDGSNRSMTFPEYLEKNRIEYLYAIEQELATIMMRLRLRRS